MQLGACAWCTLAMDLWRPRLSTLLVVLLPGGCGASTPMARGRVMTVAVPSTAVPVAARPTTCEVPEWVRLPGFDAAPQSVPAAVVTRACEELGARARRLARAPVPTSWRGFGALEDRPAFTLENRPTS